jgi:hypothetical protein
MYTFRKEKLVTYFALFLISALLVSCFGTYISKIGDHLLSGYAEKNYSFSFLVKGAIWLFSTLSCFGVSVLGTRLILRSPGLPQFLKGKVGWKNFALVFILFYIIAFVRYRFLGIPDFLTYGDQLYYWANVNFWQNGHFSMADYIAKVTCTFRGVYCLVPANIAQLFGNWFRIDPLYFYFGITTLFSALLVCYLIPQLYKVLSNRTCELWQMLVFLVLFLIIWNWMLVNVLSDLFGITFYLAGVVFALRFSKEKNILQLVLGAVFFYLSISFRLAYLYGVYGILLVFAAKGIVAIIRAINARDFRAKYGDLKRILRSALCVFLVVISLLAVSYPQIVYNEANGNRGIFAYDSKDSVIPGYTLAETSASMAISSTFVLSPIGFWPDSQIQSIKLSQYKLEDYLHMDQLLELFMSNPLDTVIYIGKKLFEGFNVQLNAIYLWSSPGALAPVWGRMALSFINYSVIFCCIYSFFKAKYTKAEILFLILNFATLIAPQLILHIEWRYFIIGYIGIYYCFIFKFLPLLSGKLDEAKAGKFFMRLAGYLYLCFWISQSMHL